jgi:drug/metabolite transporter (DMT)-like permease
MSEDHAISLSYGLMIWSGFAYIIVFGTIIAFIFWYKGVQQTSPFKTVIFHYIVPVVSMITGSVFLGEAINYERVLGGIMVFAGLLAVKWDGTIIKKRIAKFKLGQ